MLIRSIIDNPANMPKDRKPIDPKSIANKNAGPTGCVLMVDANRMFFVVCVIYEGFLSRELICISSHYWTETELTTP